MKRYSSNKYIKINCLNTLLKVLNDKLTSEEKLNKLVIHTANGIYIGTLKEPIDSTNYKVTDEDDILNIYHKIYYEQLDKVEGKLTDEVEQVSENPITITLENVELHSNNVITHLSFIEIFIDQIIGISFGSTSSN